MKMGEKRNRIFNLGSLAIDLIKSVKKLSKVVLCNNIKINLNTPTVILTYHPVTLEKKIPEKMQIKSIFDVLKKTNYQIVVTAPGHENGRKIIDDYIKKISTKNKRIIYVKSLGHNLLFNLLPYCKFMIGNSSSGIIEAPFFKIPTINIGDRQKGRFKHTSVINCSYYKI
jgi:UDP-hydrolysing UDP-N-acetyl-D-glucosamine 2-epimerase